MQIYFIVNSWLVNIVRNSNQKEIETNMQQKNTILLLSVFLVLQNCNAVAITKRTNNAAEKFLTPDEFFNTLQMDNSNAQLSQPTTLPTELFKPLVTTENPVQQPQAANNIASNDAYNNQNNYNNPNQVYDQSYGYKPSFKTQPTMDASTFAFPKGNFDAEHFIRSNFPEVNDFNIERSFGKPLHYQTSMSQSPNRYQWQVSSYNSDGPNFQQTPEVQHFFNSAHGNGPQNNFDFGNSRTFGESFKTGFKRTTTTVNGKTQEHTEVW